MTNDELRERRSSRAERIALRAAPKEVEGREARKARLKGERDAAEQPKKLPQSSKRRLRAVPSPTAEVVSIETARSGRRNEQGPGPEHPAARAIAAKDAHRGLRCAAQRGEAPPMAYPAELLALFGLALSRGLPLASLGYASDPDGRPIGWALRAVFLREKDRAPRPGRRLPDQGDDELVVVQPFASADSRAGALELGFSSPAEMAERIRVRLELLPDAGVDELVPRFAVQAAQHGWEAELSRLEVPSIAGGALRSDAHAVRLIAAAWDHERRGERPSRRIVVSGIEGRPGVRAYDTHPTDAALAKAEAQAKSTARSGLAAVFLSAADHVPGERAGSGKSTEKSTGKRRRSRRELRPVGVLDAVSVLSQEAPMLDRS